MSTIEEIKTAIRRLSLEEQAELTAELCGWTDDDWDRQMKADAAAGKFSGHTFLWEWIGTHEDYNKRF